MRNNFPLDQERNMLITWASFKEGNWDAYTLIYNSYFKFLCNYGYKFTQDVNIIEDCVHDLFVKLWTNKNNLGNPASVKNYLFKALRHAIFRKTEVSGRFNPIENQDDDTYSFAFEISFDQQIIAREEEKELQSKIKILLQDLPSRQQEIIYLRYYENLSYEEIADVMGITTSSAYKLFYKALHNLQELFKISKFKMILILIIFLEFQSFF